MSPGASSAHRPLSLVVLEFTLMEFQFVQSSLIFEYSFIGIGFNRIVI